MINPKPKKGGPLYLGMSGFSYEKWGENSFYPENLPRYQWLSYYATQFNSIELMGTFSKVPEKAVFTQWHGQVPGNFRFSVKGYQYITHTKRLDGIVEPVGFFMDRVKGLKEKLRCVFWEIPTLGAGKIKTFEKFLSHLKKKYFQVHHVFELHEKEEVLPYFVSLVKEHEMRRVLEEGFFEEQGKSPIQEKVLYFRCVGLNYKNPSLAELKGLEKMAEHLKRLSCEGKEIFLFLDTQRYSIGSAKKLATQLGLDIALFSQQAAQSAALL